MFIFTKQLLIKIKILATRPYKSLVMRINSKIRRLSAAIIYIGQIALTGSPAIAQSASTIELNPSDTEAQIVRKAAHVVPTSNQYAALKNEFIAFVHFGPNTFTQMEWGNGMEDPRIFALKSLDTDQWCHSMKAAGMKMVILTVKHHDGFVLWQSRYTTHGIMSSPFQNGKGDILKELTASCRKSGLKLGIYLSPADLFQIENPAGLYGNLSKPTQRAIPRPVAGRPFINKAKFEFVVDDYNEYFLNQLFEVLTEYGPIDEVWFDGAHPKTKGNQQYDYLAWKKLIRTLAPKAVIFGREDVRWCGNEAGKTRDTEWNVIPYEDDPRKMTRFGDLTQPSLGNRQDLRKGRFLHYQQAETNTSIREGWFYRDDVYQKVRSADDVFDIYERSVGGNSTFLLNIPPDRDGKFPLQDVDVLLETGKRISKTYGTNLFDHATGPQQVLDQKDNTYLLLASNTGEFTITLPKPEKINRIVLQEAIATHGERVEAHTIDAWVGNAWKPVAKATNIGYKRILRFADVTSNRFRVRITGSRLNPAIAHVSAHYYEPHPPRLQITRDGDGLVHIQPFENFGWKPHGQNASKNTNQDLKIFYTTDGSQPGLHSKIYERPFSAESVDVKAVAISREKVGSVTDRRLGLFQKTWSAAQSDSQTDKHENKFAFDSNPDTYWQSDSTERNHFLIIDLGKTSNLSGFIYTPQTHEPKGMLAAGTIQVSDDGKNWKDSRAFQFGNLVNDPTSRQHLFTGPLKGRFVKIESTRIEGTGKSLAIAEIEFFDE